MHVWQEKGAEGLVLQELHHFVINYHQTMHVWQEKGAEGLVLQELHHFVILMQDVSNITDSAHNV